MKNEIFTKIIFRSIPSFLVLAFYGLTDIADAIAKSPFIVLPNKEAYSESQAIVAELEELTNGLSEKKNSLKKQNEFDSRQKISLSKLRKDSLKKYVELMQDKYLISLEKLESKVNILERLNANEELAWASKKLENFKKPSSDFNQNKRLILSFITKGSFNDTKSGEIAHGIASTSPMSPSSSEENKSDQKGSRKVSQRNSPQKIRKAQTPNKKTSKFDRSKKNKTREGLDFEQIKKDTSFYRLPNYPKLLLNAKELPNLSNCEDYEKKSRTTYTDKDGVDLVKQFQQRLDRLHAFRIKKEFHQKRNSFNQVFAANYWSKQALNYPNFGGAQKSQKTSLQIQEAVKTRMLYAYLSLLERKLKLYSTYYEKKSQKPIQLRKISSTRQPNTPITSKIIEVRPFSTARNEKCSSTDVFNRAKSCDLLVTTQFLSEFSCSQTNSPDLRRALRASYVLRKVDDSWSAIDFVFHSPDILVKKEGFFSRSTRNWLSKRIEDPNQALTTLLKGLPSVAKKYISNLIAYKSRFLQENLPTPKN